MAFSTLMIDNLVFRNLLFAECEKFHDSKDMTAEVQLHTRSMFFNPALESTDNGVRFLRSKPPAQTSEDRLKTFKNWPNRRIEPKKLADAGFIYCGRSDIVECFVCGVKGHNWVEHDKPMDYHMKWNKNCPFVRGDPIQSDNTQSRQGMDVCGNFGVETLPNSRTENNAVGDNLESLVIQNKGPSHPELVLYRTRLDTFDNWPKSLKQKPAALADAGFYYVGIGDQAMCFYCGGGLKDWAEEDEPWEQHALWFPKCNFLLLKQSPGFVESVQEKHKDAALKKEDTEVKPGSSSCTKIDTKKPQNAVSEEKEPPRSKESLGLCKICFRNERDVMFFPCGHVFACVDCALALKECAVCRKTIKSLVKIYLS